MGFLSKRTKPEYQGRSTGVIWEYTGFNGKTAICLVEIDKNESGAQATVYENNDMITTSITNWFEKIATGIYHEHLSQYRPEQIEFRHRQTLVSDWEWGIMPVKMKYDRKTQAFRYPSWGQWTPDAGLAPEDLNCYLNWKLSAGCAVEQQMFVRNENGQVKERDRALYDYFRKTVIDRHWKYRYNLRDSLPSGYHQSRENWIKPQAPDPILGLTQGIQDAVHAEEESGSEDGA